MHVALFVTCFNDTLFPGSGRAVVTILERLGHTSVRGCSGRSGCEDRFSSGAVRMLTSVDSWGWTTDPLQRTWSSTPPSRP
ncbi:hypothetical protein [Streptomyces sp. NPDC006510]|uniref:hypothetical protein n=1 Tax=Streptomyces sp. NPDC006510 TaxID=3155600 RepID=UPI00339DC35A